MAPGIVVKQEPADYCNNDDEEDDENEDNLLHNFENMGVKRVLFFKEHVLLYVFIIIFFVWEML